MILGWDHRLGAAPPLRPTTTRVVVGRRGGLYIWFCFSYKMGAVGFTDAEGNFLISFDRNFVRFRFKISLHIDDIDTLHTIQSMLGIGIVTGENKQYCSFVVQDYDQIKYILCPIFLHFPLQTNKRLDFDYFYEAILIKEEKGNNLTDIKDKLLVIKNSMNRNREIRDSTGHFESFAINFCWLVGFIEGDGTLGIKNSEGARAARPLASRAARGRSPYLQIAQKIQVKLH
uniref:LAGLIDADG endonuclease n=1 Tax=Morchella brunnea TaxID=1174671 RepID=A0A8K1I7U1_9PEZI|nr:LAGLIDADG endonuclease [Morchella brunnea]UBU98503.1 LAGLIDADG endonuclease [Morchella brunnea]